MPVNVEVTHRESKWAETQDYLTLHCVFLSSLHHSIDSSRITFKGNKDKGGIEKVLFVVMTPRLFCAFEVMGLQVTS